MALFYGGCSCYDINAAATAVEAEKEEERIMSTKLIAAVMLLLAAVGVFCGYRYYHDTYRPQKRLDDAVKKQTELIGSIRPDAVKISDNVDIRETAADPLVPCENVNDDIVAWITIPDTNIDFPIVQGKDNDFYLHNGVDGQYNYELGCPFLDYRCERNMRGLNSIVYAHNMENRGMFADILLFSEESFLETHKNGTLLLKDGPHKVDFFAYLSLSSTSPLYNTIFITDNERSEYIDFIFRSAKYTSSFSVEELSKREDIHLLLLSTCSFEFEESRGVLAGIIE